MSHYSEMVVEMKSAHQSELVAALQAVFGEDGVEVHDNLTELRMYDGRPSGLKANLIIRKDAQSKAMGYGVLSNDLGFECHEEGYRVHADVAGYPKKLQDKVSAEYAERVAAKQLKKQGYMVKRTTLEDGRVKLTATKW